MKAGRNYMRVLSCLAVLLLLAACNNNDVPDRAFDPLAERYVRLALALGEHDDDFRQRFRVPPQHVEAVIRAGIEECRARTLQHISLPENESFRLEMVSGSPWSAYNWYQGAAQGLIQVETSRPTFVSSATRIGCHEGYPGHHTFSSLLDQNFLQQRGWIEFSVLPLFSPQGVIFEGNGDFAERVAFPGASANDFLRATILPIAAQTLDWIARYAMLPPEQVDAWFGFAERYRAYKINYVLGEDLVEAFVRHENPDGDAAGDWHAMKKLLSYPPTPLLLAMSQQGMASTP